MNKTFSLIEKIYQDRQTDGQMDGQITDGQTDADRQTRLEVYHINKL